MRWLSCLALLAACFVSTSAFARNHEVPVKCCPTSVFVDCEARTEGPPECRVGSRLSHTKPSNDPWWECLFQPTGCITPSADDFARCSVDVPDGQETSCSAPVRSCMAPLPGKVTCGGPATCAVPEASDLDFCAKPACLAGVIDNTDTDNDGLLDCWETQGMDYDGDGTVDLDLPALGVTPQRVDVLVEIDFFSCAAGGDCVAPDVHSHQPTGAMPGAPGTLALVQAAFAGASNTNPDGSRGIRLFIDPTMEALPHQNACAFDSTCFDGIKQASFGSPAERMNRNALLAKRVAFHYSLWAHDQAPGNSQSGVGNQPGANFMVTLGTGWLPTTVPIETGTFMHELGHNLKLGHGGGDGVNFKANYFSVMSYHWQTVGLQPGNVFDFSRAALPTLDETNLVEATGIQDGGVTALYFCPNGNASTDPASGPVNWNCDVPVTRNQVIVGSGLDLNNDRICVDPGRNRQMDTAPAMDDVLGGGNITVGGNGTLETMPLMGSDDVIVFGQVGPGADGILQTRPMAGSDDLLSNVFVWDGPNRTCDTAPAGDDTPDPDQPSPAGTGTVQPTQHLGFDDWNSMTFDFSGALRGFRAGLRTAGRELEPRTAAKVKLMHTLSDVSIAQRWERGAGGLVRFVLELGNSGPHEALGVTINDRVPDVASVMGCEVPAPGVCRIVGNYVTVSYPALATGATASAVISVRMNASGPPQQNLATVELTSTDANRANNTASSCMPGVSFSVAPAAVTASICEGVDLGRVEAISACGASVVVSNDAPKVFAAGTTTVTWTARDGDGLSSTVSQTVTVTGTLAACCPTGSNRIVGTDGRDTLTGTAGRDCILGLGGDDVIDGKKGNDYIVGGAGRDTITGSDGDDSIFGGAGDDVINGSAGNDFVDGGTGSNVCAGGSGTNRIRSCVTASDCNAACCTTGNCAP